MSTGTKTRKQQQQQQPQQQHNKLRRNSRGISWLAWRSFSAPIRSPIIHFHSHFDSRFVSSGIWKPLKRSADSQLNNQLIDLPPSPAQFSQTQTRPGYYISRSFCHWLALGAIAVTYTHTHPHSFIGLYIELTYFNIRKTFSIFERV